MSINFRKFFCQTFGWFCHKPTPIPPTPPEPPKPPEPPIPPPPPPPPIPTMKKYLFIGAYDLLCSTGDWMTFLKKVSNIAASTAYPRKIGIRFFGDCQWNWTGTQPYEYADYDEETAQKIRFKDAKDPKDIRNINGKLTLVRESGAQFPLFDYTKPRAAYWDNLESKLEDMKTFDVIAWIAALDYCTLKQGGDPKYFSPWICAKQRMMPGVTNGTWGEEMKPWIADFYARIITILHRVGGEFIFEDMNEGWAKDWPDDFVLNWFKWSNETLRGGSLSLPKSKLLTTVPGLVGKQIADRCGLASLHGIVRPDRVPQNFMIPNSKVILSGDGGKDGSGRPDAKGNRGLSESDADIIAQKIIELNYQGYEYLDRGLWLRNNDRSDLDLFDSGPAMAMIKKIKG